MILAGITISSLTGSGLFARAKDAKERTIKAQLKEEIEMAIQEIQIEELPKGNNVTLESLANGQLVAKLTEITATLGTNEITGEYKDYDYTIDSNLKVEIGAKLEGIRIRYSLNTKEYTNQDVIITINATSTDSTIQNIEISEGVTKNDDGTYKVSQNGTYTFKVTDSLGNEKTRTIIINNIDKIAPVDFIPTISEVTSSGFKITASTTDAEADETSTKSGIEKYEYYIKRKQETEYTKYESKENIYKINDLSPATEYSIYVIVYDRANNSTSSFDDSAELSVKTQFNLTDINNPINIQDGLVSYWPLQDNLINYANPGENNLVDLNGTAIFEDGSVYLESNCLSTSDNYQLEGNQTTFLQYKRTFDSPTGWLYFFGYSVDRDRHNYYNNGLLYDYAQNKVCLIAYSDYDSHISFDLDEVLPLNTWVNIVVTTNDDGTTVYFDNLKAGNTTSYKYESTKYPLSIGGNSHYKNCYANGYYKNFGVFNRALSEEEVQNLFN